MRAVGMTVLDDSSRLTLPIDIDCTPCSKSLPCIVKINMNFSTVIVLLVCLLCTCDAYRILAAFPFHGRSHAIVLQETAKALARKGHQVDVISHYPLEKPTRNYNDIVKLRSSEEYASIDYKTMMSMDEEDKWIYDILKGICDHLGNPEVQKLVKEQQKHRTYDLLLVHYLSGYQCFPAIGHLLDIPVVGVVTTSLYPWMHGFVGDPLNLWLHPSNLRPWKNEDLTFWGKLYNVLVTHRDISEHYKNAGFQQRYIDRYLGKGLPDYRQLERRTAMILTNSHYTYHGIKPKAPAVVEIGGIHINNDTTVSMDSSLKSFLDDSKDGFVYFSFGSMAVVETMPKDLLDRFYGVFGKIAPVRVVMRAPNPRALPKPLPGNTLVRSWLPQQQIFQHPNIRAFVTHGGSLGTQEALHYAVPMICVPLFAEQHLNCDILANKRVARKLELRSARLSDYESVFQDVLSNYQTYKTTTARCSRLYRDRPRSPADELVYWVEYVIRHGRNALRSPAVDLTWWQVDLLDVYAFLATSLFLVSSLALFALRKLFVVFLRPKGTANKEKRH